MTAFEFRTAPSVVFGRGARDRLGELARPFGARAVVVTGGRSLAASGELERLLGQLAARGMTWDALTVHGEPDVATIDEGARRCSDARPDVIIAVGGGSVLDAAKAIAAVAPNGGSSLDYLENVPGVTRRPLARAPLPMIAAPTTAGSGSEVTKNAVVRVPQASLKRSMRSDAMVPRVAVVDPDLCRSAPLDVTAPAALDALTHLLEGYVSRGAQPTTDLLALEGIPRSFGALASIARGAPHDTAWDDLSLASLWGGMVLANAGLGAVHGLVAPLGGRFPVPHGCGCGALLAATMRANVAALRRRDPAHRALARYDRVAEMIAGPGASVERAADAIDALRRELGVLPLARYGVLESELGEIVAGARGGSMKSNPIELTDAELEAILRDCLA